MKLSKALLVAMTILAIWLGGLVAFLATEVAGMRNYALGTARAIWMVGAALVSLSLLTGILSKSWGRSAGFGLFALVALATAYALTRMVSPPI